MLFLAFFSFSADYAPEAHRGCRGRVLSLPGFLWNETQAPSPCETLVHCRCVSAEGKQQVPAAWSGWLCRVRGGGRTGGCCVLGRGCFWGSAPVVGSAFMGRNSRGVGIDLWRARSRSGLGTQSIIGAPGAQQGFVHSFSTPCKGLARREWGTWLTGTGTMRAVMGQPLACRSPADTGLRSGQGQPRRQEGRGAAGDVTKNRVWAVSQGICSLKAQ